MIISKKTDSRVDYHRICVLYYPNCNNVDVNGGPNEGEMEIGLFTYVDCNMLSFISVILRSSHELTGLLL